MLNSAWLLEMWGRLGMRNKRNMPSSSTKQNNTWRNWYFPLVQLPHREGMSVIFSVIVKSTKIIVAAVKRVFKRSRREIHNNGKKQASGCSFQFHRWSVATIHQKRGCYATCSSCRSLTQSPTESKLFSFLWLHNWSMNHFTKFNVVIRENLPPHKLGTLHSQLIWRMLVQVTGQQLKIKGILGFAKLYTFPSGFQSKMEFI